MGYYKPQQIALEVVETVMKKENLLFPKNQEITIYWLSYKKFIKSSGN